MCLVPIYEKKSTDPKDITKNPVLNDFVGSENQEIYREKILIITNKGAFYRLDKCCETINIILKSSSKELVDYFNINDLNALIDILLREAQTNSSSDTRAQVLKLMETIILNSTYMEF